MPRVRCKYHELKLPAPDKEVLIAAFNNLKRAKELLKYSAQDKNTDELSNIYKVYTGLLDRLDWCIVNVFALIEINEDIHTLKARVKEKEKEKEELERREKENG